MSRHADPTDANDAIHVMEAIEDAREEASRFTRTLHPDHPSREVCARLITQLVWAERNLRDHSDPVSVAGGRSARGNTSAAL